MIKIDEHKLNLLQKWSNKLKFASLGFFLLLLAFSVFTLFKINQQINSKKAQIEALDADIANKAKQLANKDNQIEEKTNTINEVVEALKEENKEGNVEKDKSKSKIVKILEKDIDVVKSSPRIYLHIQDESQRKKAEKLAVILQTGGYIVPGIEMVNKVPKPTELRYCKDKGEPSDVDRIKGLLGRNGIPEIKVIPDMELAGCANVSSVRSYELWLELNTVNPTNPEVKPIDSKKLIDTKKPVIKQ